MSFCELVGPGGSWWELTAGAGAPTVVVVATVGVDGDIKAEATTPSGGDDDG